jgi:hypothetical protein
MVELDVYEFKGTFCEKKESNSHLDKNDTHINAIPVVDVNFWI